MYDLLSLVREMKCGNFICELNKTLTWNFICWYVKNTILISLVNIWEVRRKIGFDLAIIFETFIGHSQHGPSQTPGSVSHYLFDFRWLTFFVFLSGSSYPASLVWFILAAHNVLSFQINHKFQRTAAATRNCCAVVPSLSTASSWSPPTPPSSAAAGQPIPCGRRQLSYPKKAI